MEHAFHFAPGPSSALDHCLSDLLSRWRISALTMTVTAIASNHGREHVASTDRGDLPFPHLPFTRETEMEQEAEIWGLVPEIRSHLVVLRAPCRSSRTAFGEVSGLPHQYSSPLPARLQGCQALSPGA